MGHAQTWQLKRKVQLLPAQSPFPLAGLPLWGCWAASDHVLEDSPLVEGRAA